MADTEGQAERWHSVHRRKHGSLVKPRAVVHLPVHMMHISEEGVEDVERVCKVEVVEMIHVEGV